MEKYPSKQLLRAKACVADQINRESIYRSIWEGWILNEENQEGAFHNANVTLHSVAIDKVSL